METTEEYDVSPLVYLSGPSGWNEDAGDWRDFMVDRYDEINFIDWTAYPQKVKESGERLLVAVQHDVVAADALLVNFTHGVLEHQSPIEQQIALDAEIPIIVLRDRPEDELPPVLRHMADASFWTADECADYIRSAVDV